MSQEGAITAERLRALGRELHYVAQAAERALKTHSARRGDRWAGPLSIALSNLRILEHHVRTLEPYAEDLDQAARGQGRS